MSTATISTSKIDFTNKTAQCNIFMGTDYSSVTSPPTKNYPDGRTIVAMVGDNYLVRNDIRGDEKRLLDKIYEGSGTEITLTFDETKLFGSLAARFPDVGSAPAASPVVQVPATVIAPVAPVVQTPVVVAPVVAVATPSVPTMPTSPVQPTIAPTPNYIPVVDDFSPAPAVLELEDDIEEKFVEMRRRMEELQSKSNSKKQLHRVVYYIPAVVSKSVDNGGCGMFADMAAVMQEAGLVSFDGSTWYGPEECMVVVRERFAEMDAWNALPEVQATKYYKKSKRWIVKYKVGKIHPEELQADRDEAFVNLKEMSIDLQESMLRSIDNASKALDEALAKLDEEAKAGGEGPTHNKIWKLKDQQIKNVAAAVSACKGKLENAIKAAQVFDETESLAPLFAAAREAIKAEKAGLEALRRVNKLQPAK